MDNARKGEIALLVLNARIRKEGIRLGPNFRRDIGNAAKEIGISFEEAMEFAEEFVREAVEHTFVKGATDPTKVEIIQL
jgi:hypothetical protein